jgi:nucleoside-diphosphate-sugar epimerase
VFHLGALIAIPYSYQAPAEYLNTNAGGTLNIMQSAHEEQVSIVVHTSTSEVYGTAQYIPIDEAHPLRAQSPYSASKIAADKIAESFSLSYGVPLVTVRPFNTYGPRQSARAVIPTIITQALQEPYIRLGSLDPVRDLTYVGDTIDAFVRAAGAREALGQVFNVGQGKGVSVGELTQTILRLLEVDKEIVCDSQRIRPPNSEVMQLICDHTRASEVLGWRPEVSLVDGLSQTIDWFRAHRSSYKPQIYNV